MLNSSRFTALLVIALGLSPGGAPASPVPVQPLAPLEAGYAKIRLKLDVNNVTGQGEVGKRTSSELERLVQGVNRIWSQCGIEFSPRKIRNVAAADLKLPYEPKSQGDLSRLARALNPQGFEAIPLTVAGPWNFYDPISKVNLKGLGWVFTNSDGRLNRVGAMIDSQRLATVHAEGTVAHELAHALSLPELSEPRDNLMGPNGTNDLTAAQCRRTRAFAIAVLADFTSGPAE